MLIALFLTHLVLQAGTVSRFLEKHEDKSTAVVFCISSATDTDIYRRSAHSSYVLEGCDVKSYCSNSGKDIGITDWKSLTDSLQPSILYQYCNVLEERIIESPFSIICLP